MDGNTKPNNLRWKPDKNGAGFCRGDTTPMLKVFVINLKRRPDRLAEITAVLAPLGISFERIEAVDGKDFKHFCPCIRNFTGSMAGNSLTSI